MLTRGRKLPPGMEIGSDGMEHGRDPRDMTRDELREMGHSPMSALKAIRMHCIDCCGGEIGEVRKCSATACPSWPFRMRRSPWKDRRVMSDEQRAVASERLRAARGRLRQDDEDEEDEE
jgi:hypothetical protein